MKIETEVGNSLYAFTSAEGKCGGGAGGGTGCSVNGGELPPIAQGSERSSIDRPERQLTLPGCGGCGSSSAVENNTAGSDVPIKSHDIPLTSVFDCEHFQFIDEDEEEVVDDNVPTTQTSTGQDAAAPATDASPATANGTRSNGVPPPRHRATTGSHLSSDQKDSQLHRGEQPVEVSNQFPQQARDTDMSDSEAAARSKGHAVKRQVSFDDAAVGESTSLKKEIKSVLKKNNKSSKKQKGRVTFDEAVTLYSDENEDIRLLALTTGPDINCTEVFYMFDPPIEYQDIPPFEPPAEYRDIDEIPPPLLPVIADTQFEKGAIEILSQNEVIASDCCCSAEMVITNEPDYTNKESLCPEPDRSDVAVSRETENTDSAAGDNISDKQESTQGLTESSEESDKLFERFLEAEREFSVDEELNSVFHALENDFGNDSKNGAFDDNFFRKLISLLSSAEGDAPVEGANYFSSTNFANSEEDTARETEDDDNSQTHSRTLSEADSDCSISSQDTIIVRFGEDENEQSPSEINCKVPEKSGDIENQEVSLDKTDISSQEKPETYDEVFSELSEPYSEDKPKPLPRESLLAKNAQVSQTVTKVEKVNGESLSRQSSGEQSVNSGNSQELPQDADDSTSSDSRSGEVEEEIRLDDIGYDEEDADDYDEESFRGMAHGNSKIRRIIKKNALQCTLFRGIEAKRRQQPGAKYPRPKSPLLSQESLVEKLKWLTTIDEHKDVDGPLNFHSKPPDVILSTGGMPVNGSIPHSASSEDDIGSQSALYQQPPFYQLPQRHMLPPSDKAGYYVRHDGFPPTHHPSLPRQRMVFSGHPNQMVPHTLPYPQNRVVAHPSASQVQWSEQQRQMSSMTVPRNFRDWRVIQRVTGIRSSEGSSRSSQIPADYVRCPNGGASAYPVSVPPDVSRTSQPSLGGGKDELEQFVEQGSKRIDRIRKRYSLAEEDDDPTFGFARRPSVRGVQSRIQTNPSDTVQGHGTNKVDPYLMFEEPAQGPPSVHPRPAVYTAEQMRLWSRDPNWRPDNLGQSQLYGPPSQSGRSQIPMHIHRASVALTELPGNATIPYTHRKPHPDMRYHSYAESMYGSTRTLPTTGWIQDPRSCPASAQTLQIANIPLPAVSPPMLQVPPHPIAAKDERGVPEGASSSPKISSDSLYHAPVPDSIATGGPHKDEGVIYYSLNV